MTRGRKDWGCCLMQTEFQWEEKVLEMNGDEDCTIMDMYLMPLNCMLKNR